MKGKRKKKKRWWGGGGGGALVVIAAVVVVDGEWEDVRGRGCTGENNRASTLAPRLKASTHNEFQAHDSEPARNILSSYFRRNSSLSLSLVLVRS